MPYQSIEELIGNTPLVRLQRIPGEDAARRNNIILGKMEGNNPAGSVKDRPALSMIKGAEERGQIKPGDTLIEATSGNTGIALAMAAAIRGYKMILLMPENLSLERRQSMAAYGASIVLTPKAGGMEYARDLATQMEKEGKGIILDQFGNPDNPRAHYEGTGPGAFIMRTRIIRIAELVKDDALAFFFHLRCQIARIFHTARLGREHNRRAIGRHALAPFQTEVFRHQQNHFVATDCRRHRQCNARIAAGCFNQRIAGLDLATLFRAFDHGQRRSVLDGAGRVIPFHLAEDDVVAACGIFTRNALQAHQWRIADQFLYRLVGHVVAGS